MSQIDKTGAAAQSVGKCYIHSQIPSGLRDAIVRCADIVHDESWQPGARTACVFTSVVFTVALRSLGFAARPVAATVEGMHAGGRFGVGHPAYRLVRPNAWKGHLVCMVGNVLIDATIGQVRAWGVDAPLLIAAVCGDQPWTPDLDVNLPSGCLLRWRSHGANHGWTALPDAQPATWGPPAQRLLQRLASSAAPHARAAE